MGHRRGATAIELEREWLDPQTGRALRSEALRRKARHLFERYRPRTPFALTVVEVPQFRLRVVRDGEIQWEHLAATCSIPVVFPPVRIGKHNYVDGGLMGALPLWGAQQAGATRAIALNCLNTRAFRTMHRSMRWRLPRATALDVVRIEPSVPLGTVLQSVTWSAARIERYIALGEQDGKRALTSFTI